MHRTAIPGATKRGQDIMQRVKDRENSEFPLFSYPYLISLIRNSPDKEWLFE